MIKQEMMSIVYNQLAVDYNCEPEDFNKNGVIFTIAEEQKGRRELPFGSPRLEVVTMGKKYCCKRFQEYNALCKKKI